MVVCLFSACNDDDDDKIPQGPAITYAGKLPSRIGDYTFVYDDNNRCTQVKKNSYVYGEIDYDKGVVIMDDEEAKVSFNSDGYVTGISASWNYNEDGKKRMNWDNILWDRQRSLIWRMPMFLR